jgi:hypothetical protein
MRGAWILLAATIAGCGESPPTKGSFEVVGHSDLRARGMNAALAIAGTTAYIGARNDAQPILIVDIADPANPTIVGEIPGAPAMSQRELRAVADRNLLVVLSMVCSQDLHGCGPGPAEVEALKLYDITNRTAPALLSTYEIKGTGGIFSQRGPHEFYLRRDGNRVLAYVAAPPASPQLEIVDITDPRAPAKVAQWDPSMAGLRPAGADDILHSVAVSADGTRAYLSHQLSGLLIADVSNPAAIALVTPLAAKLDFAPPSTIGPHSAVEVPGRDVLVVTEEVYPMPFGTGCPWGHVRMVDVKDPAAPKLIGEIGVAENDPATCAEHSGLLAYTAHNVTATRNVALVTYYAAGLVAIDVSDAARPHILGELRPDPAVDAPATVAKEDPYLGGVPVEMWSYPIIKDGLIYVVDVRNGLYVLSYKGAFADEITNTAFAEGNSNL